VDRPDLSVTVRRAPTETVVVLAGEIDMSTVQRLATTVDELLAADTPTRVVLDMGGVTFCDSQGLGTLVVLSRKATMAQSYLVLVNVGAFLIRVLDITGLRGALMIQENA
jgi:anti-anti-sigma factor